MCGRCERQQEATAGGEELGKRGHVGAEDGSNRKQIMKT